MGILLIAIMSTVFAITKYHERSTQKSSQNSNSSASQKEELKQKERLKLIDVDNKNKTTGVTTNADKYDDGSSKISTEGSYYKLYLNRKSTMYVFVNSSETARRFAYCKTAGFMDENNQLDVRLYTEAEQREIASQPYPFDGPNCNEGNFPEVRYE